MDIVLFLLTRLMRGAARLQKIGAETPFISTHAPHARRGLRSANDLLSSQYFYSRASCEARLTPPVPFKNFMSISTHAPHARRGVDISAYPHDGWHFYSRASCEARRSSIYVKKVERRFLLTRLMRGAACASS